MKKYSIPLFFTLSLIFSDGAYGGEKTSKRVFQSVAITEGGKYLGIGDLEIWGGENPKYTFHPSKMRSTKKVFKRKPKELVSFGDVEVKGGCLYLYAPGQEKGDNSKYLYKIRSDAHRQHWGNENGLSALDTYIKDTQKEAKKIKAYRAKRLREEQERRLLEERRKNMLEQLGKEIKRRAEEEAARLKAEEERKRIQAEKEATRIKAERERKRRQEEEQRRIDVQKKEARRLQEEAKKKRIEEQKRKEAKQNIINEDCNSTQSQNNTLWVMTSLVVVGVVAFVVYMQTKKREDKTYSACERRRKGSGCS